MVARLKKTFLWTFAIACVFIALMFRFWPVEEVETVRALAPSGECVPEVVQVPLPFPIFIPVPNRDARPAIDECWYSDRLEDWMCWVPAGGPFK